MYWACWYCCSVKRASRWPPHIHGAIVYWHHMYATWKVWFFFKTSSRKSLVSNIHYRVTANAIVGNLAGVSVYIFKWQVLPQPVMSYRKTFTMQPLHKANFVRTCSLRIWLLYWSCSSRRRLLHVHNSIYTLELFSHNKKCSSSVKRPSSWPPHIHDEHWHHMYATWKVWFFLKHHQGSLLYLIYIIE